MGKTNKKSTNKKKKNHGKTDVVNKHFKQHKKKSMNSENSVGKAKWQERHRGNPFKNAPVRKLGSSTQESSKPHRNPFRDRQKPNENFWENFDNANGDITNWSAKKKNFMRKVITQKTATAFGVGNLRHVVQELTKNDCVSKFVERMKQNKNNVDLHKTSQPPSKRQQKLK